MAGYLVLARKYRSRTFDEVVGQEAISQTLINAIKTGRIHIGIGSFILFTLEKMENRAGIRVQDGRPRALEYVADRFILPLPLILNEKRRGEFEQFNRLLFRNAIEQEPWLKRLEHGWRDLRMVFP